ncbi:MAG TPA: serine hydrolase [Micromonosporaceae bacterium]
MPTFATIEAELASWPGTASAWCGPVGATRPVFARLADVPHYAASTMKVAVLAALYRAADAGLIDLDAPVGVTSEFASAKPGAARFTVESSYDHDDAVWQRVGGTATPRWLGHHMITRSSNLATNVLLDLVGMPAVDQILLDVGSTGSRVERGISNTAARDAGIDNQVTVRDLAALFGAIVLDAAAGSAKNSPAVRRPRLATAESCGEMVDVLSAQEHRVDLAVGLPPGTRVAHKNGWVRGIRHSAGVVFPTDAPPYAIVVCTTTDKPDEDDSNDDAACAMIARVATASWAARHRIAVG